MPRVTSSKKSEQDWQAEEDFRTLARAEEVKGDARRMAKAKRAGKRIVQQETRALKTKQRVVGAGGKRRR